MPNFDDQPPFLKKKQDVALDSTTPSKILVLCMTLETALNESTEMQLQLDNEYWISSPISNVEATLHRIRAARRRCSEIADELLEIPPKTSHESIAVNKIITAYLAHVGVDRMICCPRLDAALGSERADPEATSSETKSARVFPLSIISWKGWPKVGVLPKPR